MELETAVERLYTDESLAADVDDKTAVPLLKWAESVLPVLVARGDEGFDDAFVTLKKLIKSVARLIDMRDEIDMTERAERAEKIQSFAQELGIIVNVDHLESLASFEGPELVAQMVGPVAAFAAPPPAPNIEDKASSVEPAAEYQSAPETMDGPVLPMGHLPQTLPATSQEQPITETPVTSQEQTPAETPVTSREQPQLPAETPDTPQEQPPTSAEKPSLLDGIGAFFQRVAERLDNENNTDHPDDKE